MARLVVTVRDSLEKQSFDLDLPAEVTVAQLLHDLLEVLHWPAGDSEGRPLHYILRQRQSQQVLHEGYSLLENGVVRGDILLLAPLVEIGGTGPALAPTSLAPGQLLSGLLATPAIIQRHLEELKTAGYEVELHADESSNGPEFLVQVEGEALQNKGITLFLVCGLSYPHLPPQVLVAQYGEQCQDPRYSPGLLLKGWTGQFRLKLIVDRAAEIANQP